VLSLATRFPAGSLIAANKGFRWLWIARLSSFFGDSIGLIALLLYTAERFGSGLAVAFLMLAGDFVPSVVSPVAGAISDRLDRRLVMISCELVQGAVVAAIALTLPALPILLGLVAVQSCVAAFFQPASRSAIQELVADADLERANAAIGFGTNGMDGFGPLAGAALLTWLSIRGLLLLDAGTFAAAALALSALPALRPRQIATGQHEDAEAGTETPSRPGWRQLVADTVEGVGYLWRNKVIRIVTIAFCAVVFFNAVDDVCLVFLSRNALHAGNSAASLLYAGAGIGLLAGFLLIARANPRLRILVLILAGYALSSLGNLLTGVSFAIVIAFGFQVVRGLGLAAMDVGHNTLIQRQVPPELLGRAFGNVYGAVGASAGLSYLFGGALLDASGARITLIVAGAGGLVIAAIAAITLPRALSRRGTDAEFVAAGDSTARSD
jgi:MFS family permease